MSSVPKRERACPDVSAHHHRMYQRLAAGPYYEPVVETVRAYLAAAVDNPAGTARDYWALSCLPATTPRRLAALTMRSMDALVVNRPRPSETGVQSFVIVERSTLDGSFGSREAAREALPAVTIIDSEYYDAGPDQALVHGPWRDLVTALAHPAVAESVHRLTQRIMGMGRALHWRGHNRLLADDVLDRR